MDYLKSAKTVLIKEIAALKQLESSLGSDFNTAAELIYNITGKVIFV